MGLGAYFSPVNALSKQMHAMRHKTRKPHSFKLRHYPTRMIDQNDYLYVFPGEKASENICDTELNEVLLT